MAASRGKGNQRDYFTTVPGTRKVLNRQENTFADSGGAAGSDIASANGYKGDDLGRRPEGPKFKPILKSQSKYATDAEDVGSLGPDPPKGTKKVRFLQPDIIQEIPARNTCPTYANVLLGEDVVLGTPRLTPSERATKRKKAKQEAKQYKSNQSPKNVDDGQTSGSVDTDNSNVQENLEPTLSVFDPPTSSAKTNFYVFSPKPSLPAPIAMPSFRQSPNLALRLYSNFEWGRSYYGYLQNLYAEIVSKLGDPHPESVPLYKLWQTDEEQPNIFLRFLSRSGLPTLNPPGEFRAPRRSQNVFSAPLMRDALPRAPSFLPPSLKTKIKSLTNSGKSWSEIVKGSSRSNTTATETTTAQSSPSTSMVPMMIPSIPSASSRSVIPETVIPEVSALGGVLTDLYVDGPHKLRPRHQ